MALLAAYVLLALGVSFVCSIMEAVLLSVTPSHVAALESKGHPSAPLLKELKDDIDRPLAAILSLNTIAHTIGAAGAGAQAAVVFGDAHVGVIGAVLTLLILVLSEIIPKTLGAIFWQRLAPLVARVVLPLIYAMWPLVKLSEGIAFLIARGKKTAVFAREELSAMADVGERQGEFDEEEARMLRSLLRFRSLRAQDVMTPRTVMFALPEEMSVGEALEQQPKLRFSRIPVYREQLDSVSGFVLKDDILLKVSQNDKDMPLGELQRQLAVVPKSVPLLQLFERLLGERQHIALVVDEYGGTDGIVTIEDVVETLLGLEIVDEGDAVRDMQELAREQWRKRARALGLDADAMAASSSALQESEPAES